MKTIFPVTFSVLSTQALVTNVLIGSIPKESARHRS
jgi:hypothetical protein